MLHHDYYFNYECWKFNNHDYYHHSQYSVFVNMLMFFFSFFTSIANIIILISQNFAIILIFRYQISLLQLSHINRPMIQIPLYCNIFHLFFFICYLVNRIFIFIFVKFNRAKITLCYRLCCIFTYQIYNISHAMIQIILYAMKTLYFWY